MSHLSSGTTSFRHPFDVLSRVDNPQNLHRGRGDPEEDQQVREPVDQADSHFGQLQLI